MAALLPRRCAFVAYTVELDGGTVVGATRQMLAQAAKAGQNYRIIKAVRVVRWQWGIK